MVTSETDTLHWLAVDLQFSRAADNTAHFDDIRWSRVFADSYRMDRTAGIASLHPDWLCDIWTIVGRSQQAAVPLQWSVLVIFYDDHSLISRSVQQC